MEWHSLSSKEIRNKEPFIRDKALKAYRLKESNGILYENQARDVKIEKQFTNVKS